MPLANIHHFFNLHPLTFSLMLFGWLFSFMLTPTYCIISYENIIFYLCPFDLHPLYQEHSYGIKQGLGVEGTVTASVTFYWSPFAWCSVGNMPEVKLTHSCNHL